MKQIFQFSMNHVSVNADRMKMCLIQRKNGITANLGVSVNN